MELVEPIRDKEKIKEIEQILAESGTRNLLLFIMGTNTGLRISDIIERKVKDVKDRAHIELKENKTGKYKKFPINNKLQTLLIPCIKNKNPESWLFPSRTGAGHITRVQAYRIINSACKKAGITDRIGTHTLRKTFGYWHYQQYKDVAMLQKIFNHSSPSITLAYIGINQDKIDESYKNFEI